MADRFVFADEAGNFDFSTGQSASKYFVLATVMVDPEPAAAALNGLRHDLGWRGLHLDAVFHAATDPQAVRDEVFACLQGLDIRVDATVLEKRKAQPHLQSETGLYKIAWFLHFKYVAPRIVRRDDRLFVAAASIGTKRRRGLFHSAVHDVVFQVSPVLSYRVAFWPCESHPCLQIADYCTWAIQRKWERNDVRSYDLIRPLVRTEYDVWSIGTTHYY
jgi:hypothetical protein